MENEWEQVTDKRTIQKLAKSIGMPCNSDGRTQEILKLIRRKGVVARLLKSKTFNVNTIVDPAASTETLLHYTCRDSRIDNTRLLLEAKADITSADTEGFTVLHSMCADAHHPSLDINMFRLLMKHGGIQCLSIGNAQGKAPLELLTQESSETRDLLLSFIRPFIKSLNEWLPLLPPIVNIIAMYLFIDQRSF